MVNTQKELTGHKTNIHYIHLLCQTGKQKVRSNCIGIRFKLSVPVVFTESWQHARPCSRWISMYSQSWKGFWMFSVCLVSTWRSFASGWPPSMGRKRGGATRLESFGFLTLTCSTWPCQTGSDLPDVDLGWRRWGRWAYCHCLGSNSSGPFGAWLSSSTWCSTSDEPTTRWSSHYATIHASWPHASRAYASRPHATWPHATRPHATWANATRANATRANATRANATRQGNLHSFMQCSMKPTSCFDAFPSRLARKNIRLTWPSLIALQVLQAYHSECCPCLGWGPHPFDQCQATLIWDAK